MDTITPPYQESDGHNAPHAGGGDRTAVGHLAGDVIDVEAVDSYAAPPMAYQRMPASGYQSWRRFWLWRGLIALLRLVGRMLQVAGKLLGVALFFWGAWQLAMVGVYTMMAWVGSATPTPSWGLVIHAHWPQLLIWMAKWPSWLLDPAVLWVLRAPSWAVNMALGAVIFVVTPSRIPWLYLLLVLWLRRVMGIRDRT